MKLTFLLFFLPLLGLSAKSFSQDAKISIEVNGVHLTDVLNQIESQSDFRFIYKDELLKNKVGYELNIHKKSIHDALEVIFQGTNLTYRILDDNLIVLAQKKLFNKQGFTVTGKVTDLNEKPLPGVNIVEVGTTNGTVTDLNGNYSITFESEDAILRFSYVGYIEEEVEVNGQTTVNVTLVEDIQALEEVVVVGYGTVKKSDLTGAVASINEEDLVAYPSTNAVQALQGRASGVNIQMTNGEPGGDYKIRIRGASSINASSNPLFVVDGLVGGVLPPAEDIASIEVLKDASASAIYGSRGANGVVMITTKKGKAGKAVARINSSYSVQNEIGRVDVLKAHDFAEYINDARNADFYDLDNLQADTDWQDLIFRPGHVQNHQLSVSGGNENVQYYVSGVYFDQKGVIESSQYDRISLTSNLKFEVSNRIHLDLNSLIMTSNQEGVSTQTSGGISNAGVVTSAQTFEPTLPIIDEDGNYTDSQVGIAAIDNPMALIKGRERDRRQGNVQMNLKAAIDLANNVVFNSTFGIISRNNRYGAYNNRISNAGETDMGYGSLSNRTNFNFLTEQYLNYNPKIGERNELSLTGGYSYQNFRNESFSSSNAGFISDALGYWNLGVGTSLQAPSSNITESQIASIYGRVNYSFDDRYLFTFTSRYDGASRFSEENKWSFFPSGAFSWNVGNENFFPQNGVISNLKFRASYGLTGNQAISPYESLARISSTYFVLNEGIVNSVRPTAIANKDLTWETTAQYNIGMDFEFYERRILLTGDYYNKKTSDLLFRVPIPAFSGYQSRLENIGELENKGFEFQINSKNLINAFKWSTTFNITLNRNKVLSLPGGADIIYSGAPGYMVSGGTLPNAILKEGEPVGSFYGYVYEGVYQENDEFIPGGAFETEPGGEKFSDLNNDGVLDSEDRQIIGDPNPDVIWGLNNEFSYLGFDINIFLQAYMGGDMMNFTKMELDKLSGNTNATTDALNRWTPENTDTDVPKATTGRVARASTRFVEDGSYVRLKNISIGYSLPSSVINKWKISNARIYFSGQNLLTFTNYSGVDPEVAYRAGNTNLGLDYGSYPIATSYTFGINLEF